MSTFTDSGYAYEIKLGTTNVILKSYGGADIIINKSTVVNGGTTYTITEIKYGAFVLNTNITSIIFPNVVIIGNDAFNACSSLTSVSFPVATTIGSNAFNACSSLTSVSFPAATTIGDNAFQSCSSLTSVSFPVAQTIGSNAFSSCGLLTSVLFPVATTIGYNAFSDSSIGSVSFPVATTIGYGAFNRCVLLNSITFPNIQTIGEYSFMNCHRLNRIRFPSSIVSIGALAFCVSNPLAGEGLTDVWFDGLVIPSFQVHTAIYYPFDKVNAGTGAILSKPTVHYNPAISNADKIRLVEAFQTLDPPYIYTPPITLNFTNKPHNSMQTGIGSVRNFRAKYRRS